MGVALELALQTGILVEELIQAVVEGAATHRLLGIGKADLYLTALQHDRQQTVAAHIELRHADSVDNALKAKAAVDNLGGVVGLYGAVGWILLVLILAKWLMVFKNYLVLSPSILTN